MNTIKLYILLTLMAPLLASCSKSDNQSKTDKENIAIEVDTGFIEISKVQFESQGLTTTSLVELALGETVAATGFIEVPPNGRAVITAQVGGYIKNSPLLVGDKVKKGQFLVSLENIEFLEFQQEYLEAREKLKYLESEYERQQELYKEKITSEKSFLRAESEYKTTLAVYLGLKKKLELLNINPETVEKGRLSAEAKIFSPITGDIADIDVKTGTPVAPSDAIMEIVSTDHLHLELKIFEKDMLKLKIGQSVLFSIPESTTQTYGGKIHLIGKSIGADRTVKVHVHIDEPYDIGFIPGMFVQAKILTDEAKSIAIDQQAIIQKEGKSYLYYLSSENTDGYIFKETEIRAGSIKDGLQIVEIKVDEAFNLKFLTKAGHLFKE